MKKRTQGRHPESAFGRRRIQCVHTLYSRDSSPSAQNDKRNILGLILAAFLIFASCTGEHKGIETTTPEPLEEIALAMDGGSVGKYVLSVSGKEGKGMLQKLDEAGNVIAEEAVTVLVTDNQFDFTALGVRVIGTVDAEGKITSITLVVNGIQVVASISYSETKAVVEPPETPSGGDGGDEAAPVEPPKWNMVSAFGMHTCAIKDDKTVWCFGMNSMGQLGFATETPTQTAPKQVAGITEAIFIKTGTARTCVITATGDVWCWGSGSSTPKNIAELKGVASLSFVGDDVYAIKPDKTGLKVSLSTVPYVVTNLITWQFKKIAAISAGFYFLEVDGDVKYWDVGGNVTQKSSSAVDIAAYDGGADGRGCAVDNTDLATCWGPTALPNVSSSASVALGGSQRCIIKNDQSLWCHDFNKSLQKIDIGVVKSVALGQAHICAIDTTGYLWCWGNNASGQLGDGTINSHDTPVKVK